MKQTIQLRLGQSLTMTPQLQQAIKLLQLSTLDLQREIQDALDSNLMLETAEEQDGPVAGDRSERLNERESGLDGGANDGADRGRDLGVDAEVRTDSEHMPAELPVDSDWGDTFDAAGDGGDYRRDEGFSGIGELGASGGGQRPDGLGEQDLFAQQSRPQTLHDHLAWQLNLTHLDARDRAIAEALIDAIDADGYLRLDLDELPVTLADPTLERDEIEAVLHRVQSFDPTGVAARDPRECLLLQLRQVPVDHPHRADAIRICEVYFAALGRNDLDELRRYSRLDEDALRETLRLIRSMQPRPGALVSELRPEYVIPDVFVRKIQGRWQVELNPETTPKLRVNSGYADLIRRADQTADNLCLRSHLQEARWFIKSLTSRNDTVLRVAGQIVELQQGFFDHGEEAMRPLVLRDVADALGLHESTVSRVTTQKYMYTPRGTFEFKYFFSSHVATAAGGECSSTAIRAFIRKLVAAETPHRPLSDSRIADILSEQGINVARRTVAKYREALGIPPSNERKRLQ